MSTHEDRFRIPGGSLDLDLDDDHEHGMAKGDPLKSPPEPQSIAHLTPADLSRILSWIPHHLAARTAEYVLALNISGNAFRNLDFSALDILANHDSTMAEQLARVQNGVLPYAPPPEIEDHAFHNGDGAIVPPVGDSSLLDPSDQHATALSTSSGASVEHLHAVPPSTSLSPPTSPTSPHPPPPAPEPLAPPSSVQGAAGDDSESLLSLAAVDVGASASSGINPDTEDIDGSTSGVTTPSSQFDSDRQGKAQISVDDPTSHSDSVPTATSSVDDATTHPSGPGLTESATTADAGQAPDMSLLHLFTPQSSSPDKALPAAFPHDRLCSISPAPPAQIEAAPVLPPGATSSEQTPERPLAPAPTSPPCQGSTQMQSNEVATSSAYGTAEGHSSGAYSTAAPAVDREASPPVAADVDGAQGSVVSAGTNDELSEDRAGESGAPGDHVAAMGPALDEHPPQCNGSVMGLDGRALSEGQNGTTGDVDEVKFVDGAQARVASVGTGSSPLEVHASSQNQIGVAGNPEDCAGTSRSEGTTPTTSDDGSTVSAASQSATSLGPISSEVPPIPNSLLSTSSSCPRPDLDSPESCASSSIGVLETPPFASSPSRPCHVDNSSRVDIDLLQFSPFTKLAPDALSAELFKDAYIGADENLMAVSCEEQSEFEIGSAGVLSTPNLGFLAHGFTPIPLSSAVSSHALGAEGTTLPLHENSADASLILHTNDAVAAKFGHNHANQFGSRRDGSPILHTKDVPKCGHNQANQLGSRLGPYFYRMDFHRCTESDNSVEEYLDTCSCGPLAKSRPAAVSYPGVVLPRSPGSQAQLPADTGIIGTDDENKDSSGIQAVGETDYSSSPGASELRPPILGLSIQIPSTSLGEELSQLSPLFSPIGDDQGRKTPINLKRGTRSQHVPRRSRETDTSDAALTSDRTKRVLVEASAQTDEDVEEDILRRRIKALERELRSLRAVRRRSEERARESKPRSFWKKLASTDRAVPPPEPISFGFLESLSSNFQA